MLTEQHQDLFYQWLPYAVSAVLPIVAILISYRAMRNTTENATRERRRQTENAKNEIIEKVQKENKELADRLLKVELACVPMTELRDDVDSNLERLRDIELAIAVMKALGARKDHERND